MNRFLHLIISSNHFIILAILSLITTDQWELSNLYFGKDLLNPVLSAIFIIASFIGLRGFIPNNKYAILVFLLLSAFTSEISHRLHYLPEFVSFYNYGMLIILVIMILAAQKNRKFNHILASIFVIFVIALLDLWLNLSSVYKYLIALAVSIQLIKVWLESTIDIEFKINLVAAFMISIVTWGFSNHVVYASQDKYYDPVVLSKKTPFQQIDITTWEGNYWYYTNRVNQFSSVDYWLFYEPLVHPAMGLSEKTESVLILGGENGMALKEVLKYQSVNKVTIIPLDTTYLSLASQHSLFLKYNSHAFESPKVLKTKADIFYQLHTTDENFDLIVIDLPDPVDIESNQYYTEEFYELCFSKLSKGGILVTQAGSPYFAMDAFDLIDHTLVSAGFNTLQYHNQIMSLGEWGWILAAKNRLDLDQSVRQLTFEGINTHWINQESMYMMTSFGKRKNNIIGKVNRITSPVLYEYYNAGNWQFK